MKAKLNPTIAFLIIAVLWLNNAAACAPTMAWSG